MAEKSELQKAADRVREMQVAVEKSEKNLTVCQADYDKLQVQLSEANRNLADTRGLLNAQRDKLQRELHAVQEVLWQNGNKNLECAGAVCSKF